MKKYYTLKFATDEGKNVSLTVPNANATTDQAFSGAIDLIIESGAVKTDSGALTKLLDAFFYEQTTTAFDMKNI